MSSGLMPKELERILWSFKNGKTLWSDGPPKGFYLTFWDLVGPDLLELFQEHLHEGQLSAGMNWGLVTLLYKEGLKEKLKNWWLIALLNFDYKLLAKVLAE
ncbi:hypothetical protein Y1Q_0008550 [Alligator mississippiensis]|uniref:Uncharacterized protein n=1 Tax=Alligator mississippiensis TaxID=8496 RepID=A0A151M1Q2_ALLMI|nr:hypothetical protein Y1Q_0008550 [Alligator mississippiensis]